MRAGSFWTEAMVTEGNEFCSRLGRSFFTLAFLCLLTASEVRGQGAGELLLSGDNAYNPIPSPDGKMIAYVRTGWGRPGGSGGFGRSDLVSEVAVITGDGKPITPTSLTDTFLEGWTPNGSALVCYRYWKYSLVTLDGKQSSQGEFRNREDFIPTERVSYLPLLGEIAWSRVVASSNTVIETQNRIIASHDGWLGGTLLPSPDGRYIALLGDSLQKHLWVYDLQILRWSDLGPVTVHPDKDWDWMNATWNPWFSDSSHLAYISGSTLVISEPDGNAKRTIPVDGHVGLATPSPDGKYVAYLSFDPAPRKESPGLQFWGGTVIWILPLARGGKASAVTEKNSATTYDLRWLDNHTLVFDRIVDEVFPAHARIWKVAVRDGSHLKAGHAK
jgi:hypothetical protein